MAELWISLIGIDRQISNDLVASLTEHLGISRFDHHAAEGRALGDEAAAHRSLDLMSNDGGDWGES